MQCFGVTYREISLVSLVGIHAFRRECMQRKLERDIPGYITRKLCILTILYIVIENTMRCTLGTFAGILTNVQFYISCILICCTFYAMVFIKVARQIHSVTALTYIALNKGMV